MFNQVTIIGFGLIGSSIARAMIEKKLTNTIVCVDKDQEVCTHVLALGIADDATTDASLGVEGSDLVILCCPVGAMEFVGSRIAGHLQKGAIVTDVGSVKGRVIEMLQPRLPSHAHLVPAHPISGAENTGPDSGFAELFINRWCIVTPLPHTELQALEKVTKLWEAMGSMVEIMEADHHDLVLGLTSSQSNMASFTATMNMTYLH